MSEETVNGFSLKNFILQILIILLILFLLMWIFPTKSFINNGGVNNTSNLSSEDIKKLEVLYGEIFSNNIYSMKEAGVSYFTDERRPSVVGKSVRLTLQEMYNKHLVLKLKDKNGNACSATESYVEMTKSKEDEFQLKVNLKCGDEEDYIIVYLGCYNYCKSGVCEKQVENTNESKGPVTKPVASATTYYEYTKTGGGSCSWSDWSDWSTDAVSESANKVVQTKTESTDGSRYQTGTTTEKYISGYKTEQYIAGYTTEQYISGYRNVNQTSQNCTEYVDEQYISGYETKKVKVGVTQVQTGTTTKTITEKVQAGTVEVYSGSSSGTTIPSNTSTYVYKKTGSKTSQSCTCAGCSNCSTSTVYTWDVYKVTPVYKTVTSVQTVPVYTAVDVYETQKVPVYSTRKVAVQKACSANSTTEPVYSTRSVPVYQTRTVAVYSTRTVPVYNQSTSTVKYYRYKTYSCQDNVTYTKWSTNINDTNLVNQGYKLSGNKQTK